MNAINLKTKLVILVSILLLFSTLIGVVGLTSSSRISEAFEKIEKINFPKSTLLLETLAHIRSGRIASLELALPKQSEDETKRRLSAIEKSIKEVNLEDKKYSDLPFMEGEEVLYKETKVELDKIIQDFIEVEQLAKKSEGKEGTTMDALRELVDVKLSSDGKKYREELNKLLEWQKTNADHNSSEASEAKKNGKIFILSGIFGALILGGLLAFIVLKNIISDQDKTAKAMEEAVRSFNMVEKSSLNTVMCGVEGKIVYINEVARKTLKTIESFLPEKVEALIGHNFDFLSRNPGEKSLPSKTLISIGPKKFDLSISAISDKEGKFIGPMLTMDDVTEKVELIANLNKASNDLANASSNVQSISLSLNSSAEQTSNEANTASVASEEVSSGVQSVANNMEEMVMAIKEIAKITNQTSAMSNNAMRIAQNANNIINQLGVSSMDIGNVIKVISTIAQQTNLLALNATIEAARAGESGKGFAVVANEVKELANQTAKATQEITKKIEAIQNDSKNAMESITEISGAIEKVNGFAGNLASSIEEQSATTNEVTRVVTESAEGMKQIGENISKVSEAAANTSRDAGNAERAAKMVSSTSELLKKYVTQLSV